MSCGLFKTSMLINSLLKFTKTQKTKAGELAKDLFQSTVLSCHKEGCLNLMWASPKVLCLLCLRFIMVFSAMTGKDRIFATHHLLFISFGQPPSPYVLLLFFSHLFLSLFLFVFFCFFLSFY